MSAADRPMKIALGSNDDASSGVKYFAMQRQISKSVLSTEVEDDMTLHPVNVLMVGSGEYTTGYVDGKASDSDKGAGVVALTMFDLRRRGKVNHLAIVGLDLSVETYPKDSVTDPKAYLVAIAAFLPGDAVTIFTPDDTHFEIALAAIQRGLHVMITKPAVKTLEHHRILHEAAERNNVLVAVEVHKRWDPIYGDARDKIQSLGPFSYMYSYMSQPKHQLETFKAWAGKGSDISYYLNSHHIDFHEWCVGHTSRPISVTAMASTGVAESSFGRKCEDTITLTVQWENIDPVSLSTGINEVVGTTVAAPAVIVGTGTAVYTSSWVAPRSDVHSQQRFFYMGQKGEVIVDQAHRGYNMADDSAGYRSVNPLFMKYTPTNGKFSGQLGYGYRSFEAFIDAVQQVNSGKAAAADYEEELASVASTYRTTAILEAGRRSLDENRAISIVYGDVFNPCRPTSLSTA